MRIKITPRLLSGRARAIASKSEAHRLLICAALGDRPCEVGVAQTNEDIEATARALSALGAGIKADGGGFLVTPLRRAAADGFADVDCGESGSTLRFLVPVAAALGVPARFTGSGRLPERPMAALNAALRAQGCGVSGDFVPFSLSGALRAGVFSLAGNVSSQYISGLLFALPLLAEDSELRLTGPLESAGYVEITLAALRAFGVRVETLPGGWRIPGGQRYRAPARISAGGDWSNAAFWLCAFALGNGGAVAGLDPGSAQGDRAVEGLLRRFGATNRWERGALRVGGGGFSTTERLTVDARDIPDLVPALAAAACGRRAVTAFTGCGRLRLKESDRIESVCGMIEALGGSARAEEDGILVEGRGRLSGGRVDARGDHRIAMAAAVASCLCEKDVIIDGAQAVNKSYPAFFDDFRALGGIADVL